MTANLEKDIDKKREYLIRAQKYINDHYVVIAAYWMKKAGVSNEIILGKLGEIKRNCAREAESAKSDPQKHGYFLEIVANITHLEDALTEKLPKRDESAENSSDKGGK